MGSDFHVTATASLTVWNRILEVENAFRRENNRTECVPESLYEEGPVIPWGELLVKPCQMAIGRRLLSNQHRAFLDPLLAEGDWYAWTLCHAYEDHLGTAGVTIVERRLGEIVESRAHLKRGYLVRKDPYLLLAISEETGTPPAR